MAHVVTQSCCNDASCINVCPVNCIHPTPDEPDFGSSEMLFIDPATCIDCGACVEECPVDAIRADDALAPSQKPYIDINAGYFADHDSNTPLVRPKRRRHMSRSDTLRVGVVGSGPAAFYTAGELLKYPGVQVDMIEKLPTPHGLVRAGVAPDHQSTKRVSSRFDAIAAKPGFRYVLGVEIGKHVMHDELTQRYEAVVYAHGASADRRLGISGEELPGSVAATDVVGWYNGHPDFEQRNFDLSGERVVLVGNGNVALDVARILLSDIDDLASTDIADHALDRLRTSNVREVVVLARRGVAHAAYTVGEFLALGDLDGVDVVIDPDELVLDQAASAAVRSGRVDSTVGTKIRLAREFAARAITPGNKRIILRYMTTPTSIEADDHGVVVVRTARTEYRADGVVATTSDVGSISASMVVRAIGYTARRQPGLPFDDSRGVIPNTEGRVLDGAGGAPIPGLYVSGWVKRGAAGGIGMNKVCGEETASSIVADFTAGLLETADDKCDDVTALASSRGATVVDRSGWGAIDDAERRAGVETGRDRVKIVNLDQLTRIARAHAIPVRTYP